jgi:hypothetical protein
MGEEMARDAPAAKRLASICRRFRRIDMSIPFSGSCGESAGMEVNACARRHDVLRWPCAAHLALAVRVLSLTFVHRLARVLTNGDEPDIGMLDQKTKGKFGVDAPVEL